MTALVLYFFFSNSSIATSSSNKVLVTILGVVVPLEFFVPNLLIFSDSKLSFCLYAGDLCLSFEVLVLFNQELLKICFLRLFFTDLGGNLRGALLCTETNFAIWYFSFLTATLRTFSTLSGFE